MIMNKVRHTARFKLANSVQRDALRMQVLIDDLRHPYLREVSIRDLNFDSDEMKRKRELVNNNLR